MATYAVVDLGSNTVRLLIAEHCPPSRLEVLFQAQEITRLGEEVCQTQGIGEEAAERTLSVLARYREIVSRYGPEALEVAGTEALRVAVNAEEFLNRVEVSLGWKIRILSPQEEACLSLLGVRHGSSDLPAKLIVLDIGGSSTELAQAEGIEMKRAISLPLGAVGIYQEFLRTDPPLPSQLEEMFFSLESRLDPLLSPFLPVGDHLLVGTAGTITTLSAIHLGLEEYDADRVSRLTLTQSRIRDIFEHLCQMPLAQRIQVRGLETKRADIILSGAAILLVALDVLNRDRIRVSDGGLREGLLLNLLGKKD